ncbi:MAG: type II toxin-antitoxin system Phd/YefM family antitoxin [Deltaproteobacteria bacterium]|nr:type II toxin-antitoxin system Phd/YefM family antitoxin [Deltaproteobacteria bacterium]
MKKPRTTTISVFKAKALRMIDQVARSGERLVVQRHGKPVVAVVPLEPSGKAVPGRLRGTVIDEKNVVSPLGAKLWSAADD